MRYCYEFVFLLAFFGFVYAQSPISVEAYDEQGNNQSQITLRLKLINNTSDTLYNIHARYFLNNEKNRTLKIAPYYMEGVSVSLDTIEDYLAVKISFPVIAPGVFPNSSGISLGMRYSDDSSFHKQGNYSYPIGSSFTETDRIPVYYGDVILVGFAPGILPDANPISMVSGSELLLDSTKRVRFAWREVEGANSYKLTVLSATDSSMLIQKETEKTRVDTALNEGDYFWRVESSEFVVGNGFWDKVVDFTKQAWNSVHTFLDKIIVDGVNPLIRTPLAARKDTYLLDVKWGEMSIVREWDRPHLHHELYDEEESYRCWAVGAQMLNHYYKGNVTQDEIKLKFKSNRNLLVFKDSVSSVILGAFLHSYQGAMSTDSFETVLYWTLNSNVTLNKNNRSPTESEVKLFLKDSVPLYIWTHTHVEILDAYKKTLDGNFFVRVVNTDNNGDTAWVSLDSAKIEGFMAPQVVGPVRMSDSLIHKDSDGDGLMDYDELYRFGTDSTKYDSDGDSISDKIEIMSYTILESLYGDSSKVSKGVDALQFADVDKDNYRAEHDLDSDGGGVSDGKEDLNFNGMQDNAESSPYNADDDFFIAEPILDIPDTFTIYALNELRINDGVKCSKADREVLGSLRNVACSVASESQKIEYAVNIGRSVIVNHIASKGGVFLRDRSIAVAPIKIYSLPDLSLNPFAQGRARIRSVSMCLLQSLWPYKVENISSLLNVGNSFKEIFYKEIYTLKNGDTFKSLKVHPGGKLLIEPGEMFVGDIQLESGSRIQFTEPGRKTVIHANGSVIWRSWTLNDDKIQVAKGFKLIQHSSETMFVEGQWAGTILAPNADLVLGQSNKTLYGRFLGRNVDVHQYSSVYNVYFDPETIMNLVFKME
ncbi:hypothetical protein [Fibrobacter succinogenes]|uniref:hypothetical protein n=1 Tax=Fibrobacter succinogenes TaxID=833 RepID=UPI0015690914|nr:hypothetical protein [Fibrobacter succinogenes]